MGIFGAIGGLAGNFFAPGIGGALGAGLGSAFDERLSANSANSASEGAATRQFNFQSEMSSTAYQRAVIDMQKAGLNPMLAYSQGGASTPGGAAQPVFRRNDSGLSSAVEAAQVGNTLSQTDLLKAQAAKVRAETPGSVSSSVSSGLLAEKLEFELKSLRARYALLMQGSSGGDRPAYEKLERERMSGDIGSEIARGESAPIGVRKMELERKILAIEEVLKDLQKPKAGAIAKLYERSGADAAAVSELGTGAGLMESGGHAVSRAVSRVGELFHSAGQVAKRYFYH